MASSVAEAYLTLVPKMQEGWKGDVESKLGGINVSGAGKTAGTGFAGAFTPAMKAGMLAGAAAAATAAAAVTKGAVEQYAQYEQLVGGVQKLYGDASDEVMRNASEAYKTVGMSANQYMDTATSFSASLVSSLGGDTQKAAEQTQVAMQAMSDNANVFGTDMQSVQNAFQGFAKNNFTMLDNLKLGYAGSQEGMQQLLADAEKLTGQKFDISNFSDIVTAIDAVQEHMGIAGTTANEAAGTIEGSVNSAKAAWENWLTGLADDNANVEQLTNDLIDSVGNVVKNLAPVVGRVLLAIAKSIPPAIGKMLSAALVGLANLTYKVITKLQELGAKALTAIRNKISDFTQAGGDMIRGLVDGLSPSAVIEKIKSICASALDAIKSFFKIKSPSRVMMQMGGYITAGLANGINNGAKSVNNAMRDMSQGAMRSLDFSNSLGALSMATPAYAVAGSAVGRGDTVINLNYSAGEDATQMVYDIAAGLRRLNMIGG